MTRYGDYGGEAEARFRQILCDGIADDCSYSYRLQAKYVIKALIEFIDNPASDESTDRGYDGYGYNIYSGNYEEEHMQRIDELKSLTPCPQCIKFTII